MENSTYCNVTQAYYDQWNNTFIKNVTKGSGSIQEALGSKLPSYQNCTITSNFNRTESDCPKFVQTECVGGKFNDSSNAVPIPIASFNSTELCECTGDFPFSSGSSNSVECTCINDQTRNATAGFKTSNMEDYIITKNCTVNKGNDTEQLTMDCITQPCISNTHLQMFNLTVPDHKSCNYTSSTTLLPNITDATTTAPATTSAAGTPKGSSSPQPSTASSGSSPQTTPKAPGSTSGSSSGSPSPSNTTSPRTVTVSERDNTTEEDGSGEVSDITELLNASSTVETLLSTSSTPETPAAADVQVLKHVAGSQGYLDFQKGGASSLNPMGAVSILPLLLFFYYIFMFAGIAKKTKGKPRISSDKEE